MIYRGWELRSWRTIGNQKSVSVVRIPLRRIVLGLESRLYSAGSCTHSKWASMSWCESFASLQKLTKDCSESFRYHAQPLRADRLEFTRGEWLLARSISVRRKIVWSWRRDVDQKSHKWGTENNTYPTMSWWTQISLVNLRMRVLVNVSEADTSWSVSLSLSCPLLRY